MYSPNVTLARGFPHSEIPGSKLICSSPRLIAAYHVLLRLLMPRHSPCALISLTFVEANAAHFVSVHSLRFGRKLHIALLLLLSKHHPLRWADVWSLVTFLLLTSIVENPSLVSLNHLSEELCRLIKKFSLAKLYLP